MNAWIFSNYNGTVRFSLKYKTVKIIINAVNAVSLKPLKLSLKLS